MNRVGSFSPCGFPASPSACVPAPSPEPVAVWLVPPVFGFPSLGFRSWALSLCDIRFDDHTVAVDHDVRIGPLFNEKAEVGLACLIPALGIGERAGKHARNRSLHRLDEHSLVLQARQVSVPVQILPQVLEKEVLLAVPDILLEIAVEARRPELRQQPLVADQLLAGARKQSILRRNLARCPLNFRLRAFLMRIEQIAPALLQARLHGLFGVREFCLCQRALALLQVQALLLSNDLAPGEGGAHGLLEVVELPRTQPPGRRACCGRRGAYSRAARGCPSPRSWPRTHRGHCEDARRRERRRERRPASSGTSDELPGATCTVSK